MATATAPTKALVPFVTQVRNELDSREEQIASLLGSQIPVERFMTVALHAVNSNPDIARCTPLSIVEAIREAAALRLEPTGLLGDAYLVRYGDKARLMPGYRGLMKLARRTGDVDSIDAQVVFEHDPEFEIRLGSDPAVVHKPSLNDRGAFVGAYAYARLRTGELVVEWMSNADMEKIRRSSRASDSGPWVTWPEEMYRKSALRRLMKRLPLTTEAQQALALESEAEQSAEPPRVIDRSSKLRSQLHKRLQGGAATDEQAAEDDTQDVIPADNPAEPVPDDSGSAPAEAACSSTSPYEPPSPCTLPAGHDGKHRSAERESW